MNIKDFKKDLKAVLKKHDASIFVEIEGNDEGVDISLGVGNTRDGSENYILQGLDIDHTDL